MSSQKTTRVALTRLMAFRSTFVAVLLASVLAAAFAERASAQGASTTARTKRRSPSSIGAT